jgi:predicted GNAT family N-acyltransferase
MPMDDRHNIRIAISDASHIPRDENNLFEEWFETEFGHMDIEWAKPQWYLRMYHHDTVIGVMGILKRQVKVGKERIEVGGICNVVIKANMRGKKLLKYMMRNAQYFIKNQLMADFGLLLCRDEVVPIYQRYNWYLVDGSTFFDQKTGIQKYPKQTMILNLTEKQWPEGDIFLCGMPW